MFEGYWNATIYSPTPYVQSFPSSIDLCAFNIQDHGIYHDDINFTKGILSGCTKMAVDVIDYNHLRLHGPSGVIYLARKTDEIKTSGEEN